MLHKGLRAAAGNQGGGGFTYATLNPSDKGSNITLSNGDLSAENSSAGWNSVRATIGLTTGKWYWEITTYSGSSDGNSGLYGIMDDGALVSSYAGASNKGAGVQAGANYDWLLASVTGNFSGAVGSLGSSTILGFAMDVDAGKVWISKNGTWVNGDPTGAHVWGIGADTWYPTISCNNTGAVSTANFGATAFAYSVPSGFNAGVYT